jgi:hypothetical protein
MTNRNLTIAIQSNDRHCQSEPGECCPYLNVQWYQRHIDAHAAVCVLFPVLVPGQPESGRVGSSPYTPLETENGWPIRCADCLEAEASHV